MSKNPSQLQRVVEICRSKADRTVTCRELAAEYIYHKAASRLGVEAKAKGFEFKYVPPPSGGSVMDGKYVLVYDKDLDRQEYKIEASGQLAFA